MAAHFAKRNTKFGGGGKRGRAKIPSPQPLSFLPASSRGGQASVQFGARLPAEASAQAGSAAVSFVQKRFGFRQTNAPRSNFQEFVYFLKK